MIRQEVEALRIEAETQLTFRCFGGADHFAQIVLRLCESHDQIQSELNEAKQKLSAVSDLLAEDACDQHCWLGDGSAYCHMWKVEDRLTEIMNPRGETK